ncbi:23S rRNA (guanosine(2251)-2'-O)-methyltransferase RlmB [Ferrovibrio sp.]|uniref:23S rRNA (guanosine(2251)-2'-O)-methyltransferase RlmB n=1 Tax=Ferrovibrio sp. TaxID=1917215 RepID=UPI000CA75D44|nr:23S rRNA (guanosine(2251)-2'-O)-methyltransferase RlmB [Ferrovibrio sp.]PJI37944.1 MAG: 23S rRNA (guanosine(2251)-2'-O)-methyltransferase RlmB [Ferrovibrio sp.]
MSRRKPDARKPARSATSGGHGAHSSRDQRPNRPGSHPGGKPGGHSAAGKPAGKPGSKPGSKLRPYGSQGKPGRGEARAEGGRPEGGRPTGKRPQGDRREDRNREAPRRYEGQSEERSERPQRDDWNQERDRAERHGGAIGGGRRHGGDQFSSRSRETRGDLPVWLYGIHAVTAALDNDERLIRRILITRETREALGDRLPRLSAQPETVDRMKLDSLLPPGAVHQGIAMLTDPLEDPGVESLKEPQDEDAPREVVLLLDHVTDPRNVGAILRSAAAFGARAVIVTDRHAPEATGALAKAASGGLEIVPLIRVTNLARALDLLAEYGFWRVGLEMETDKSLAEAVHDIRRVALVLGAEDEGLRRLTREKCDFLAKLPMTGAVESLNVSAAATVALYECVRV